ncbi:aminodeoxychorismate synthase component I [Endothiovibrio diazotrophicus]
MVVRTLDHHRDPLALMRANPSRYPYLLESVAHGPAQARYDLLFAFPGERRRLDRAPDGFLQRLDQWWAAERIAPSRTDLPFVGGWFLYLGYETAAEVEPVLSLPPADDGMPAAFATRVPAAAIRDHRTGLLHLVAERRFEHLLDVMAADFTAAGPVEPFFGEVLSGALEEDDPQRYIDGVKRVKRYIYDGDVFQVNLARAWRGVLAAGVGPVDLYARLRRSNPAPFAALVLAGAGGVISSSPERLVERRGDLVQTRPIAGTRPRGKGDEEDASLSCELLGHPKERAEHIMLIDLERNDLGRVCVPGSVEVSELMVLESYAHVHHIVSNVRGRLRDGVTPGQVIRALFPGGTITGCPKVRCMEIIAELEGVGRGAYTGSLGYLNRDGSMDLNILIRTLVQDGRRVTLRAGAGIVADSDPERELEETRAKAQGMLLALSGNLLDDG